MTPEVYVDKEIMPLLLKANCPLNKVIKQDFRPVYYTIDFNDEGWQDCDAYYVPTQSQVMKWLREMHKIEIDITSRLSLNADDDHNYSYIIKHQYEKYHYNTYADGEFLKYEEACDAAIKYCLTNLIINL